MVRTLVAMMGSFIMLALLIWLDLAPDLGTVIGEEPRSKLKQIVLVVILSMLPISISFHPQQIVT